MLSMLHSARDQEREREARDSRDNCNHSHQDQDQARELKKRIARQVAISIIEGLQLQLLI